MAKKEKKKNKELKLEIYVVSGDQVLNWFDLTDEQKRIVDKRLNQQVAENIVIRPKLDGSSGGQAV